MNLEQMSYEQLLESFEPLIKKTIKQVYGERYSEDLYQIGMIALWEAKEKFNKKKGYFASYAKKLIWGRMLNFLRKENNVFNKIHYSSFNEELLEQIAAPVPEEKTQLLLEKVMPLLSEKEKQWYYEAIVLEKAPREIAKNNNVSIETVKTWRSRVIQKLRKQIKSFDEFTL